MSNSIELKIARHTVLSNHQQYLNKMISSLNSDTFFNKGNVRFAVSNSGYHFVERFLDRDFKIDETLPSIYQMILKHRCEIIYFSRLKTSKRLELVYDDIVVGLSYNTFKFMFRTIYHNEHNHQNTNTRMIINNRQRYYET